MQETSHKHASQQGHRSSKERRKTENKLEARDQQYTQAPSPCRKKVTHLMTHGKLA